MEKIIVDPKVFITCRLCLEYTGNYQITPTVQSQIKYCFDIDVDPFDSMPQLICSKCETILSEYVTIKRTFVGKQNALLARREVQKGLEATQQGVVSSSQENDNNDSNMPRVSKSKIDFSGGLTSSATEDRSRSSSPAARKKKKINKKTRSRREVWEDAYNKSFVCRLCNKKFVNQGNVMRHVRQYHKNVLFQHKALFINSCTVKMKKVDQKANHINSLNVVVSPKKIISDKGRTAYYHVIYTPIGTSSINDENDIESEPRRNEIESESSDDEILLKRPPNKKRRVLSRSSTDTVCLDGVKSENNIAAQSDADETCASADSGSEVQNGTELIEDTSDSEHGSTMSAVEPGISIDPKSLSVSVKDYRTIQRIISTCQHKYMKRVGIEMEENSSTNSDLNINNKILNIGRKVINKPGMACKGLLRFIENKNLELEWQPILEESLTNKENFVRILPKLKGKQDNTDKIGWKFSNSDEIIDMDTEQSPVYSETEAEQCSNAINVSSKGPTFCVDDLLKEALKVEQQKKVAENKIDDTRAVLYAVSSNNESNKILLNANPVANPKQLKKKTACPKSAKPKNSAEASTSKQAYDNLVIAPTGVLEADLHMPIITSTTSLAVVDSEINSVHTNHHTPTSEAEIISTSDAPTTFETPHKFHDVKQSTSMTVVSSATRTTPISIVVKADTSKNNDSASSDIVTPRIKVKPVSELMSETALNSLNQRPVVASRNTWNLENELNNLNKGNGPAHALLMPAQFQMPLTSLHENMPVSTQILTTNSYASPTNGTPKAEFLILDSVTFPNTKTDSPIKYVQNLLQAHNIILLDKSESITPDFSCLIKFKVQFSRDTGNQVPVLLLLSVFSFENQFYLGVREPNKKPFIEIQTLSACWQWEVIKTYTSRDDVNQRLLVNAKKVSQRVYDHTNTFLRVVKAIRVIPDI